MTSLKEDTGYEKYVEGGFFTGDVYIDATKNSFKLLKLKRLGTIL